MTRCEDRKGVRFRSRARRGQRTALSGQQASAPHSISAGGGRWPRCLAATGRLLWQLPTPLS